MNFYQNRNLILKGESDQIGNLWLGDFESARNKRNLKADKITYVLTAGLGMKITFPSQIRHKILPLYDAQTQNIQRFFSSSYQFIDQGLRSGNVLIHCYAGVSRSTTIMAAYLMKKNQWKSRQTLTMIKKIRCVIGPNRGFMIQLRNFQSNMNKQSQIIVNEQKMKMMQSKQFQQQSKTKVESMMSGKNFVQGFLSYKGAKRQSSVAVKPNKSINLNLIKKIPAQQRSKTLKKQILVAA